MRNTTYVMPLTGKQQLPASIRSRELLLCALLYQVAKDVSGDLTGGGGSGVLDDLLAGAGLALCACELVAYDGCKSCGQGGDDGLPNLAQAALAFILGFFLFFLFLLFLLLGFFLGFLLFLLLFLCQFEESFKGRFPFVNLVVFA